MSVLGDGLTASLLVWTDACLVVGSSHDITFKLNNPGQKSLQGMLPRSHLWLCFPSEPAYRFVK